MGDHRFNPNAIAKANGQPLPPKGGQQVQLLPLGDGYHVAGFSIDPAFNKDGEVCALLSVMAGRESPITGLQLGKFFVCELGKKTKEEIRAGIDRMLGIATEEPAKEEERPA